MFKYIFWMVISVFSLVIGGVIASFATILMDPNFTPGERGWAAIMGFFSLPILIVLATLLYKAYQRFKKHESARRDWYDH